MTISGISGGRINPTSVKKKDSASKASSAASSKTDQVSLTDQAASLGDMSQVFAQVPVVDGARVDSVRESLAQGVYEINSYQIATKLVEIEFLLHEAEQKNASA